MYVAAFLIPEGTAIVFDDQYGVPSLCGIVNSSLSTFFCSYPLFSYSVSRAEFVSCMSERRFSSSLSFLLVMRYIREKIRLEITAEAMSSAPSS